MGTFPLRIQSYSVTKNAFINATVPNGMAAFHEARKGMQVLELKGGAIAALQQMGFGKASDAEALIAEVRPVLPQSKPLKSQPHVVLAVMESMGRDVFESHKPGVNDTLGALAGELDSALVFKQSLCVGPVSYTHLDVYKRQDQPFASVGNQSARAMRARTSSLPMRQSVLSICGVRSAAQTQTRSGLASTFIAIPCSSITA